MTEPTGRPAAAPYDEAMAALTRHATALPAAVLLDLSVLRAPSGAPSRAARAAAAACHARRVAVVALAGSGAEAAQLERLLVGCEARVLVRGRGG
jgi:hypothetical protein